MRDPASPLGTSVPPAPEADLVRWFAHLERHDAPVALRGRVLAAARGQAPLTLLQRVPLGAWGLASAALLLLALGTAVGIELATPALPGAPALAAPGNRDVAGQVRIREDATLTLFHDVESFDDVGLAAGELLADWGR